MTNLNHKLYNSNYFYISITLSLVALVYLLTRTSGSYLFGMFTFNTPLNSFGGIWNSFPSFAFTFVFSLLSYELLKPNLFQIFGLSFFWLAWGFIWELIQNFEKLSIPYFSWINNYANNGTFDSFDMIATLIGSILSLILFIWLEKMKDKRSII